MSSDAKELFKSREDSDKQSEQKCIYFREFDTEDLHAAEKYKTLLASILKCTIDDKQIKVTQNDNKLTIEVFDVPILDAVMRWYTKNYQLRLYQALAGIRDLHGKLVVEGEGADGANLDGWCGALHQILVNAQSEQKEQGLGYSAIAAQLQATLAASLTENQKAEDSSDIATQLHISPVSPTVILPNSSNLNSPASGSSSAASSNLSSPMSISGGSSPIFRGTH